LVVFIDSRTKKSIGPFPYDRSVLASAVNQAAHLQARAVVLKFFLDQHKSQSGDLVLAEAMKHIPVALEACLNKTEKAPNPLPDRFILSGPLPEDRCISGTTGWLPIPLFAANAADLGFVDCLSADQIPTFERYGGLPVKSLATCCLELAFGARANIAPRESLMIAGKSVSLDNFSQFRVKFPARDDLDYVSFLDFIHGRISPDAVKDRVVIIGYDGQGMSTINTPVGKLKLHRAFCYGLLAAYDRLESSAP
jgi:adenylate cyclase